MRESQIRHGFNSKLVRLKVYARWTFNSNFCFNSKLVRLKVQYSQSPISFRKFQFQTGSIKRSQYPLVVLPTGTFQFQTGSIKSFSHIEQTYEKLRFNSKLVRLKVT